MYQKHCTSLHPAYSDMISEEISRRTAMRPLSHYGQEEHADIIDSVTVSIRTRVEALGIEPPDGLHMHVADYLRTVIAIEQGVLIA